MGWRSIPASAETALTVGRTEADAAAAECRVPLTLASDTNAKVCGVQCELRFDGVNWELSRIESGPAATSAQKSVSHSLIEPGRCRIIVAGINQNTLENGTLAEVCFTRRDGTPSAVTPIAIEAIVLCNAQGESLPATGVAGAIALHGQPRPSSPLPRSASGKRLAMGETGSKVMVAAIPAALFAAGALLIRHKKRR